MTPDTMRRLADEFWRAAGGRSVAIAQAVAVALPIVIVRDLAAHATHCRRQTTAGWVENDLHGDERLRGCLFARRGRAYLFVRDDDDPRERRFTLAHEAAHFMLHHEKARQSTPTAVLDG